MSSSRQALWRSGAWACSAAAKASALSKDSLQAARAQQPRQCLADGGVIVDDENAGSVQGLHGGLIRVGWWIARRAAWEEKDHAARHIRREPYHAAMLLDHGAAQVQAQAGALRTRGEERREELPATSGAMPLP